MLSSNCFETGASSMKNYTKAQPKVINLVLSNLPANTDADTLKKIAGTK
jgi:hypothetical protein